MVGVKKYKNMKKDSRDYLRKDTNRCWTERFREISERRREKWGWKRKEGRGNGGILVEINEEQRHIVDGNQRIRRDCFEESH